VRLRCAGCGAVTFLIVLAEQFSNVVSLPAKEQGWLARLDTRKRKSVMANNMIGIAGYGSTRRVCCAELAGRFASAGKR
jgi:hypothetical protein